MKYRVLLRVALRERRDRLGMSLSQLAGILGVDKGTLWDWERGRNHPRLGEAMKLAAALECTVEDIWSFDLADGLEMAEKIADVLEGRKQPC